MRLLKFFLWIILVACITWGSAIIFGPSLISFAIKRAFKDSIEVGRLEVSPKLEVTASFLKFDIAGIEGSGPIRGLVRGADFSWQIDNGFALVATFGPSRVEGFGGVQEIWLKFAPRGLFDWNSAELDGILSSVEYGQVTASQVKFSAELADNTRILKSASVYANTVNFNSATLSTDQLTLSIADVDLRTRFDRQAIPFGLKMPGSLTGAEGRVDGLVISGEVLGHGLSFDMLADRLHIDKSQITAEEISMSSTYNFASKQFGPEVKIEASQLLAETPEIKVLDYEGSIKFNNNNILHSGSMNIDTLLVENDVTYIAKISDATLQYDMSMPAISKIEYPINLSAMLEVTDNLGISAEVNLRLLTSDLKTCIFENCPIIKSAAHYIVRVPNAKLSGRSYCEDEFCSINQMVHSVSTDNTEVFFRRLAEEKVVSPLVLPVAYYAMTRSEPSGSGHRLDF